MPVSVFFPFPKPVVTGTFVARPQRFLINATLDNGSHITAYCANSGSFEPEIKLGCPVLLWTSPDPLRKRRHTWRAVKLAQTWIGTDTHLSNRLVEKALVENRLPALRGFALEQREPRGMHGRRLDFLLTKRGRRCYVEVKSAMVAVGLTAQFPDSRSERACAHLAEMSALAVRGTQAILIFLIQRDDVRELRINRKFDPDFTEAYDLARQSGVEIVAVRHSVTKRGFGPPVTIPITET